MPNLAGRGLCLAPALLVCARRLPPPASRMVPHRMTLDIYDFTFRLLVEEQEPRALLRRVFATYGLDVSDREAEEAQGQITIGTAPSLPEVSPGMERIGEADGTTVWYGAGRFCLRTDYTSFLVSPSEGTVLGTVSAEHLPQAWARVVWPTILSLFLLLRRHRFYSLHAAALVYGDVGLLASAASGSGKSTLACNLLRSGWRFLSDDTVLLRPTGQGVAAYAFRIHFSLREDSRALFPELTPHWQKPTGRDVKQWVPVKKLYPDQAADACLPRVLVFPELSGGTHSRLVPLSNVDALYHLAAQSALALFGRDTAREHLALLSRLVAQASCYRLLAARDLLDDPDRSHQLLAPLMSERPKAVASVEAEAAVASVPP